MLILLFYSNVDCRNLLNHVTIRKKMSLKALVYVPILFTLLACAKTASDKHTIATIPEASGIDYCENTQTFMVANDEGTLYEMGSDGSIKTQNKLGKYDLEGVVCQEDVVVLAVETGKVLVLDRVSGEVKKYPLRGDKGKKYNLSKKAGIEGITYVDGQYYLSVQAKKKKDAKLLVVKLTKKYAKVMKVIEHGIVDTAGLHYHDKKLYMVSDKRDKLYVYDVKRQRVLQEVKLEKFAQEGVSVNAQGDFYFADDDGSVKRYSKKELGMK